jgi:Na+/H+-dicarboxylate symporter
MVITIVMSQIGMDVTILLHRRPSIRMGAAIFMGVTVGIIVGWFLKDKLKEIFPG